MHQTSLSTRLFGLLAAAALVTLLLAVCGLWGIGQTNRGLETVYSDRVVPLTQLKLISDAYAVSIIDAVNKGQSGLFSAEKCLSEQKAARAEISRQWALYRATFLTEEERRLATEVEEAFKAAEPAMERLEKQLSSATGSLAGALSEFNGPLYQVIDPISGKIGELMELQLRVAREEYTASQERYLSLTQGMMIGCVILVVLLALGGFLLIRSVSRSLLRTQDQLSANAAQTTSAASQVASTSEMLAQGASKGAASLEETSASLEEMTRVLKRSTENALHASTLAKEAHGEASSGQQQMRQMVEAMAAISSGSQNIGKVLHSIDEIAFQTNILALNASVEAARAGEVGAGFSVVADEVRNLAQRSAQAARETASMVEASTAATQIGTDICGKVAEALAQIVNRSRQVNELVQELATASKEQTQGIGQISTAVGEIDSVIQSSAAQAEESASAAQELSAQAHSLEEAVLALKLVLKGTSGRA